MVAVPTTNNVTSLRECLAAYVSTLANGDVVSPKEFINDVDPTTVMITCYESIIYVFAWGVAFGMLRRGVKKVRGGRLCYEVADVDRAADFVKHASSWRAQGKTRRRRVW